MRSAVVAAFTFSVVVILAEDYPEGYATAMDSL